MASVEKRGNSWRVVVFVSEDDSGKQIKRTKTIPSKGITKREAQKLANKFEAEVLKNKNVNDYNMTLAQFVDYWNKNYAEKEYSITTLERNKQLLVRINGALGHIRLRKLEPKHILAFIRNLEEDGMRLDGVKGKLSPRTIQMHYKLISAMLSKAVKWELIDDNPCRKVDTPKAKSKKTPIYDEPTLLSFLNMLLTKAKLKYQAFFLLALTSGLRRSEILGLKWSDINFEKSFLRISQAAVRAAKVGIVYKEPKTDESAAPVPIAPFTLGILRKLQQEQSLLREVTGKEWTDTGIIFTTIEGKPMFPSTFDHWLTKFTERHGFPSISPHSFRHMAATYALDRGFDLKFVSNFIRHSQISTTGDIYAHVLPAKNQQLVASLDELVGKALKQNQQTPMETV